MINPLLHEAEDLPGYRMADKCCYNCKNYVGDWDGWVKCKILIRVEEERDYDPDMVFVDSSVKNWNICDLWGEDK